jgi:myo-inositol-1(or 4)-monophosphatase
MEDEKYFCSLLQADRRSKEEKICSVCASFCYAVNENENLEYAYAFAAKAHEGQTRKGTDIPYLIHLVRTWWYVKLVTDSLDEQVAALLHDVLEDTAVTKTELQEAFGSTVTALVVAESECKREDMPPEDTWMIRKTETLDRIRNFAERTDMRPAMHITMGDKLANLYSFMYEYRQDGDVLWQKFNQKDKKKHGWYYGELGKIFEQYFTSGKERELVLEYQMYYREVFGEYEVSGKR